MRRIPRHFLPALLLAAFLLPAAVGCAETELPYAPETVLSVLSLTQEQRALAHYLYTPVMEGRPRIELPEGTRYDDVAPAMRSLMQDHPEMFHLGSTYTVGYQQHTPDIARYVSPEYRMDVAQAQLLRGELYAIARDLAERAAQEENAAKQENAVKQKNAVKPLLLHDALAERVTYGGGDLRHTAVGALLEGEAVCEGYANALTLLYRMAGIPCGTVTGAARDAAGEMQLHSWNIARLNGYTLIDVTWNDQPGRTVRWYYGLSADQMAADHTPDAGQTLPDCGEQDSWHRAHGMLAATEAEAFAALRRMVTTREPLDLRITDPDLFRRIAEDPYGFLGDYNEAAPPAEGFYGSYAFSASPAQQCISLMYAE